MSLNNVLTKRNVLVASIALALALVVAIPTIIWLGFGSIIIFSLITYPLNYRIFQTWAKFTVAWLVIGLLVFFIPSNTDWQNIGLQIGFPALNMFVVSVCLAFLYIILSTIIITYKYFATRGK